MILVNLLQNAYGMRHANLPLKRREGMKFKANLGDIEMSDVEEVLETIKSLKEMLPVAHSFLDGIEDMEVAETIASLILRVKDILRPLGKLVMKLGEWYGEERIKFAIHKYEKLHQAGLPDEIIAIYLKDHTIHNENLVLRLTNMLPGNK
jgi:hypothetical protein